MSRSYKPDERIRREWEVLSIFGEPPVLAEERHPRAIALHASCLSDGMWSVPIVEAGLVTYHAVVTSLQARNFEDAIGFCNLYFSHPDADSDDISYLEFKCRLAVAKIASGDIDGGLSVFRYVIDMPMVKRSYRLHLVRNDLISLFEAERDALKMDRRLSEFIAELLEGWTGQARKAKIALKAQSIGELLELLHSTYPPRKTVESADV